MNTVQHFLNRLVTFAAVISHEQPLKPGKLASIFNYCSVLTATYKFIVENIISIGKVVSFFGGRLSFTLATKDAFDIADPSSMRTHIT